MNDGYVIITGFPDDLTKPIIQKYTNGAKHVTDQSVQKSAFGELSITESTPAVQLQFPYGINIDIVNIFNNNGTTTVDSNRLKLSTGAAANQSAQMASVVPIKYNPGQGGLIRFTGVFNTGVANSIQLLGVGDTSDGYFFGYNGIDFGVLRLHGGAQEIRILTITTKSTTAENITITLDGDAKTDVAVTDATAGDITTTANDITGNDFSDLGRGWDVHSDGDGTVIFTSYDSSPRTGTYSLSSATTAVGTFAQALAGVSPTDKWTAQTSWSEDKAVGADILPLIDWTKGNVFQIRYQWLGFGQICFFIENPLNGEYILVHRIAYANANTLPSVNNPTLPLCAFVENITNTSDIILYTSSMGGFVEGRTNGSHIHHGITTEFSAIGTTETPVLVVHNKPIYQGKKNRVRMKIILISVSVDGTKPSTIRVKIGGSLTAASYTDINTNNSVANFDISATAISGGDEQFGFGLAKSDSDKLELGVETFFLNPDDKMTITAEASAGTIDGVVSVNWEELF